MTKYEYKLSLEKNAESGIRIGDYFYRVSASGGLKEELTINENSIREQLLKYARTRIVGEKVSKGKQPNKLEIKVEIEIN